MKKDEPLIIRLHFQKPLIELIRLIGYDGVAEAELRETVKTLIAEHGMEKMEPAASELARTDEKTRLVTLRPEVRRIAFQILGPPPERADYETYWASQGVPPPNKRSKEQPPPALENPKKKTKRQRKKTAK